MNGADRTFYPITRQRPELLEQRKPGEHVWIMAATYRLDPLTVSRATRGGAVYLDAETLATASVCCFICERPYRAESDLRALCPGEPR